MFLFIWSKPICVLFVQRITIHRRGQKLQQQTYKASNKYRSVEISTCDACTRQIKQIILLTQWQSSLVHLFKGIRRSNITKLLVGGMAFSQGSNYTIINEYTMYWSCIVYWGIFKLRLFFIVIVINVTQTVIMKWMMKPPAMGSCLEILIHVIAVKSFDQKTMAVCT